VKTNDSRVVIAEIQLASRRHHAIADVAVCAARSDLEVSRQNGARKANNHLVADFKVASATHDAADVFAAIGGLLTFGSNANLTPTDCFSVALWLSNEFEDLTNDNGTGYAESV
jgi:hypothetical protein